jgi:hypothetical protein
VVRDANTGFMAMQAAEPGSDLPLHSGLGRLTSPARDLAAALSSRMPAVLAPDGRPVTVASVQLHNADSTGSGPIQIDHLRVRGADRAFGSLAVGLVADRISVWVNGVSWGLSAPLTTDSLTATIAGGSVLSVAPGETLSVELRVVTRTDATAPGVRFGVDRPDIGVVQPGSALLAVSVRPEAGLAFPLWTEAGGFANASLAGSYSNFPNPFAAGRQATTFAYFMPAPGHVTLRVLTPHGELVTTLLDGAPRTAGLHQDDLWAGRNGHGDVVFNGVYIAELDVQFDNGTGERLRRTVAVVR